MLGTSFRSLISLFKKINRIDDDDLPLVLKSPMSSVQNHRYDFYKEQTKQTDGS